MLCCECASAIGSEKARAKVAHAAIPRSGSLLGNPWLLLFLTHGRVMVGHAVGIGGSLDRSQSRAAGCDPIDGTSPMHHCGADHSAHSHAQTTCGQSLQIYTFTFSHAGGSPAHHRVESIRLYVDVWLFELCGRGQGLMNASKAWYFPKVGTLDKRM